MTVYQMIRDCWHLKRLMRFFGRLRMGVHRALMTSRLRFLWFPNWTNTRLRAKLIRRWRPEKDGEGAQAASEIYSVLAPALPDVTTCCSKHRSPQNREKRPERKSSALFMWPTQAPGTTTENFVAVPPCPIPPRKKKSEHQTVCVSDDFLLPWKHTWSKHQTTMKRTPRVLRKQGALIFNT